MSRRPNPETALVAEVLEAVRSLPWGMNKTNKRRGETCSRCGGPTKAREPRPCRTCNNAYMRTYYQAHREDRLACSKLAKKRNPKIREKDNETRWKRRGITFTREQYTALILLQDGCCAICRARSPGTKRVHWSVDHDHDFGHVRGLLCNACNTALGGFRDSPALLRAAAKYIEAHRPQLKLAGQSP